MSENHNRVSENLEADLSNAEGKNKGKWFGKILNGDPVDTARLWVLFLLYFIGILAVSAIIIIDNPTTSGSNSQASAASGSNIQVSTAFGNNNQALSKDAENVEKWQGLSPAIHACYVYGSKSSPIIIAFSLGMVIGVLYIFGTFLYKKFRETSADERGMFWSSVSNAMNNRGDSELRDIISEFREYEKTIIDRRNIYWSLFARVALAILVVSFIALLIGSCKIESQAGLPIISGIIAFIIGQGSELIHAAGTSSLFIRPDSGAPKHTTSDRKPSDASSTSPPSAPGKNN